MAEKEYVIDCDSRILGRLASHTASLLLKGNKVALVNAEKTAISGHAPQIIAEYKRKVELIDKANPEHSPYWSRRPDFFVKRIVRGMLPWKKTKGKDAYKRLRVFIGVPAEFSKAKLEKVDIKGKEKSYETSITVKDLAEHLGYKMR
jgi:large subunit ribosomal protein L13